MNYDQLKKMAENQEPCTQQDLEDAKAQLNNQPLLPDQPILINALVKDIMQKSLECQFAISQMQMANILAQAAGLPLPYPEQREKDIANKTRPAYEPTEGEKIGSSLAIEFHDAVEELKKSFLARLDNLDDETKRVATGEFEMNTSYGEDYDE